MSDETREAVKQWRKKAENDWKTVEILLESQRAPADTVCFHCQQFAEKLLKGLLTRHNVEAPRTHDIRSLVQSAAPFAPELSALGDAADKLTAHGVRSRYPDDFREIYPDEMNQAVESAGKFGDIIIPLLDE